MATDSITVFSGDTVRIKSTFRDYAVAPAVGALADPDSSTATWTVYDSDMNVLASGAGVRESTGVYHYDYTTPTTPTVVVFEFKGLFSTKPQLSRVRLNVKFNSSAALG